MPVYRLEIEARPGLPDPLADATRNKLRAWEDVDVPNLRTRKVFIFDLEQPLSAGEAERVLDALRDPVAEVGSVGRHDMGADHDFMLTVSFLPGVTDTLGKTAKRAAEDCLSRPLAGAVRSATGFALRGFKSKLNELEGLAARVLYNPLIQQLEIEALPSPSDVARDAPNRPAPGVARPAQLPADDPRVQTIALRTASDEVLQRISVEGTLSLSLAEMQAIARHFAAIGRDPTDAELECVAQTWSEHCKHKIFASPIDYCDPKGRSQRVERGLFSQYIKGATSTVAKARVAAALDPDEQPFLVSVFHDNAGVVRFTEADHLVFKVETHNSPSALDPYGGAMTGIVGVNRDSFGTGLGADLLTNVWGYCLGPANYAEPLPKGLMHPRRIREGVHEGVIDGGNQSGIPYSRGFELFDERYVGKPLVYCGTVAAMPVSSAGRPTHEKRVAVGDAIVMVGGRIGKDGIHGATFSSAELDESSPVQAVQIGDPIIQKMMWDMLSEARELGLYSGMTDNGAGGLSSSVGEMAEATGGARIDLAHAPLKYPGLQPWEILISEAQERMTLAVPQSDLPAFLALARRREVEASVLGEFTDSGRLEVTHGQQQVAELELEFLHDGVPLPVLEAQWDPSVSPPANLPELGEASVRQQLERIPGDLEKLLAGPNMASGEAMARHYDHEVKGLSVVKPYLGLNGDVAATASVMRVRHGRDECVVLAEGILPFWSEFDTRAMAMGCVDEAVRRVLCAGARIDRMSALDNFCWPDPIVSAKTPDGRHKLAQLVRCCEGLYDACTTYGVPLISGKDSMKNDAIFDGKKISIPPTLLVSVMGQLRQASRALTLEPLRAGDRVFVLGATRDELGGSEWMRSCASTRAGRVPETALDANWKRYQVFAELVEQGVIRSAHTPARGGLLVAWAQMCLAGPCGLDIETATLARADLSPLGLAFSESTGRIIATCRDSDAETVQAAFAGLGSDAELFMVGRVIPAETQGPPLRVKLAESTLEWSAQQLQVPFHSAWGE